MALERFLLGGRSAAVRVNGAQVGADFVRQPLPQPQGRVSRSGPAGRHPQEHNMQKAYATLVSLIAFAQARRERDEKGATAVEYGLMVGLIAVVIIGAVTLLGDNLSVMFDKIA